MIIAPDAAGWGRPDPISGDVSVVAWPPLNSGNFAADTDADAQASGNTSLVSNGGPVNQYRFKTIDSNRIKAVNNGAVGDYFVVGAYASIGGTGVGLSQPVTSAEGKPIVRTGTGANTGTGAGAGVATQANLDTLLPSSFLPPALPLVSPTGVGQPGTGKYYWVYLRRPANPFDTDPLTAARPNREMVVVDAMRFPYITAGGGRAYQRWCYSNSELHRQ